MLLLLLAARLGLIGQRLWLIGQRLGREVQGHQLLVLVVAVGRRERNAVYRQANLS